MRRRRTIAGHANVRTWEEISIFIWVVLLQINIVSEGKWSSTYKTLHLLRYISRTRELFKHIVSDGAVSSTSYAERIKEVDELAIGVVGAVLRVLAAIGSYHLKYKEERA